jgi:hypothetical protein
MMRKGVMRKGVIRDCPFHALTPLGATGAAQRKRKPQSIVDTSKRSGRKRQQAFATS